MLDLPALGADLEWLINPGGITVSLLVNSTLAADFDNDGDVDADDLMTWETHVGTTGGAGRAQGDADGDFDVDGADFLRWQQLLGSSAGTVAPVTLVPEPRTLWLSVLGVLIAVYSPKRA